MKPGRKGKAPACPRCGSADQVIPIVYGLPNERGFDAARRGEIRLGGCLVSEDSPAWWCRGCDREFGRLGSRK